MPTEGFYIYSVDDLGLTSEFDFFFASATTNITGSPDVITLSDDDQMFDDEGSGGGSSQLLEASFYLDGALVAAAGEVVQNVGQSVLTNSTTGETGLLIVIQINGAVVGFASTIPLSVDDQIELGPWLGSPKTISYDELHTEPACFTRGALILTVNGEVPVERLRVGDKVLTRDHGAQPIRWVGNQTAPGVGKTAPVRMQAGAMGNRRALTVSPMHRMLLTGWQADLLFGVPEILVPARELVNGDTICRVQVKTVDYFHIMLDRHEVIYAEGCPSESFAPTAEAMGLFGGSVRAELLVLFPHLLTENRQDTRPTLTSTESTLLRAYL